MNDLLLSYYGDDLTGSTDVMEALALGGVPTVLFTRPPSAEMLQRFAHCRAVGLAGTSRSESPAWMDEHLTSALGWLKALRAELCHYKVCSTFDSSPGIGSIGRAIEIGRRVFQQHSVPILVGAPQLKRYTAFGNLFAAFRGDMFRIDRHPVMSRHPVTPMREADLLLHLGGQTPLFGGLLDLAALRHDNRAETFDALRRDKEMVLIDVDSADTQALAGAELWRARGEHDRFIAGSSGVEYALLREWSRQGIAPGHSEFASAGAVDKIAVVSGSVSPTTERQIQHALASGFAGIALDPIALAAGGNEAALADAAAQGNVALGSGRSVVLYTALGPQADRGAEIDSSPGARHRLGRALGQIMARLVHDHRLARVVIAGGDTSSHALGELGVEALTVKMPLPETPGSPLCAAHAGDPAVDGLQIALKGGQIGTDGYFEMIRRGESG